MGWNYLFTPKLQWCNRWSLGKYELFHPTFHNGCNNLIMLRLQLIHVNKMGARWLTSQGKWQNVYEFMSSWGKSRDNMLLHSVNVNLISKMEKISQWMNVNKLSLNVSKTKCIVFSLRKKWSLNVTLPLMGRILNRLIISSSWVFV